MARLIKTDTSLNIFANITTCFVDGTTSNKKVKVGDIVEGLRYVKNGKVESVSGKIKSFTVNPKASTSLKDTFAEDIKITAIVIDASQLYEAKTVTVPTMEIVEDAGVENVQRMKVFASMTFEMDLTYSNGIKQHQSLQVGDYLENMVIMGEKPGDPDKTGSFTVASFSYTVSSNVITITTVNLANELTIVSAYDYRRFISFEEIITETVESGEDLMALINGDYKFFDLTVDKDLAMEEPIVIPEGKEVVLNLGSSNISSPEGEFTIDNKGSVTINGGVIVSRGINNDGTMVIDELDITTTNDATVGEGAIINNGKLTIFNVVAKTQFVGSTSDPKGPACVRNYGELTIKGGSFESPSKRTYCIISGDGVVNIPEGAEISVNGVHGGIAIDGGTIEINSGEFVSEEYYGLYVSNDYLTANVVVNGGHFDGPNYSVWCGSDDNESVDSIVEIRGGVFDHPLKDQNNVAPGAGISVSGGKFKQVVPAEYLADGYVCTEEAGEDGYYEVVPAPVPNEEPAEQVEEPVEDNGEPIEEG